MPRITVRVLAIAATVIGWLCVPSLAHAQDAAGAPLLVHLPLDGSTAASVGGETVLLGSQPQAVAGKVGQAMKFGGDSVIAVPVNISPSDHGEITITAWVKVDEAAPDAGGHTIVSGGGNAAPALRLVKRRSDGFKTRVKGGRAELLATSFSPNDEWIFVSGAIDIPAETLRVLQGDSLVENSGIRTDTLYDAPEYENPNDLDDPDAEKRAWVFVGADSFNLQRTARGVAIDEVRVYAGALDANQLRSIRDGGRTVVDLPGEAGGDINIGDRESTTAEIERRRQEGGGSDGDSDITIANRESPTAEIERKRQEAGEQESEPTDPEPDPEPEPAPEPEPEADPEPATGWRLSTTDVRRTGVTGIQGDIVTPIDFEDRGLSVLDIGENFDNPCYVRIAAEGDNYIDGKLAWRELSIDRCGSGFTPLALFADAIGPWWVSAEISPALVSGVSLCPRSANNPRVKGVEIRGAARNADGTSGLYQQDRDKNRNCDDSAWTTIQLCGSGYIASGIVAHFLDRANNDELVGMQLICRKVIPTYD